MPFVLTVHVLSEKIQWPAQGIYIDFPVQIDEENQTSICYVYDCANNYKRTELKIYSSV